MPTPTPQEIQQRQGTRLSEKAPWETYADEMTTDSGVTPELAAQIAEYAEHRYSEEAPVSSESQEELCRLQEENEALSREYQWLKPEEYADFGARIGRVMDHQVFITTLRKAKINCHYRQHMHPDKAVLWVLPNAYSPPEVACWVQLGQMPELSIMNFDQYGVPLAERRRGWRTCLLQLILKGIISEEKANKLFGRPRQDKAFERYNSTLQAFRNAGSRLE